MKRSTPGQLRLAIGTPGDYPHEGEPVVLKVEHWTRRGPDIKMVGKILRHLTGDLVFYHAHDGGQWHRNSHCPAPTDQVLVEFLLDQGIEWIYVYDRKRATLFRTTTSLMASSPVEIFDNRIRHYLPEETWEKREEIIERRVRGERLLVNGIGNVVLRAPYLETEWTLKGGSW